MQNDLGVHVLASTGYTTWRDFYFNVTSISAGTPEHAYEFINPQNQSEMIKLPFSDSVLKAMALEESKLLLRGAGFTSFVELYDKGKAQLLQNGKFGLNVIVKNKNEEIVCRKISLQKEMVELLIYVEGLHLDYLLFDEGKNKSD